MDNRKLSIRDEPNIRLRRSRNVKKTIVLPIENTSPCVRSRRPRVYRHNAHTCFNMCARGAGTHGDVLNVLTETCLVDTLGFQCVTRTFHDHNGTHNTTQQHDHNTTPHRDRQRQRKEDRDRDKRKRRDKTSEERRFILQCGGTWPFLLMECFFWRLRETLAS